MTPTTVHKKEAERLCLASGAHVQWPCCCLIIAEALADAESRGYYNGQEQIRNRAINHYLTALPIEYLP